jgi:hypothetical protein
MINFLRQVALTVVTGLVGIFMIPVLVWKKIVGLFKN